MTEPARAPVFVLCAMTGAGRTDALAALAGAGVACTDNLPPELLAAFAAVPSADVRVVAVDARGGDAVAAVTVPPEVAVLFLDADDRLLVRRQADTTVPHPCAAAGGAPAAIAEERRLLGALRSVADAVVDVTDLTAREVGERVLVLVEPGRSPRGGLRCTVSSFGFKHGPQTEADWVVDVRVLPNPFWVPALRPRTGLDSEVRDHVLGNADGRALLEAVAATIALACDLAAARGRRHLHVAVGCTGGRHRSVAVAVALGERLRDAGREVEVRHRDVDRPDPRT